jgi:hypothetical protein
MQAALIIASLRANRAGDIDGNNPAQSPDSGLLGTDAPRNHEFEVDTVDRFRMRLSAARDSPIIAQGGAGFGLHGVAIVFALLSDQPLAITKRHDTARNIGAFGGAVGYQACVRLPAGRYLNRRRTDIFATLLLHHHTFVGRVGSLHERLVSLMLPTPLTHLVPQYANHLVKAGVMGQQK